MMEDRRRIFKLISLCLSYPDEALAAGAPELTEAAAGVAEPSVREPLAAFVAHLASEPLLRQQAHYTEIFDLEPRDCLNLTYHLAGEREERGRALCDLLALYREGGFKPAGGELPDYLPLLLEFLSLAPEAAGDPRVSRCLAPVPALAERIRERRSIYAAPLAALGRMLPAEALPAEEGPPRDPPFSVEKE
jgi:nitrate reductase molybdenum cofactor assembly chaperone NarJ/NarW